MGAPTGAGADGYDRSPTRVSSRLLVVAGAAAVVLVAAQSLLAAAPAAVGVGGALAGLRARNRRLVELGAMVLFAGVLLAGIGDGEPVLLVGATVGTLLVWDQGEQAITVGEQVGARADTRRGEFVHAAASVLVGATVGGLTLAAYTVSTGGFPVAALLFLLVAAVVIASALRD